MSNFTYRLLQRVTVPTISMRESKEYFFRFEAPIVDKPDRENPDRPIHIGRVIDLETGELGEVVLGKILHETLMEKYPDDAYVGKSFRIVKTGSGKKGAGAVAYNLFYVDEIAQTLGHATDENVQTFED